MATSTLPTAAPPRARRVLVSVIVALVVAGAVAFVLLRDLGGPLKTEVSVSGQGATGPARLGQLVAVTIPLWMPRGEAATITGARGTASSGLDVRAAYLDDARGLELSAAATPWPPAGAADGAVALSTPGTFVVKGGREQQDARLALVARASATGQQHFRSVEVDYLVGSRHHRKRFELAFGVCVNPESASRPTVDPCADQLP